MEQLISSQVNALLQTIILIILVAGIGLKRGKRHYLHGIAMLAAVIMNLLSFTLKMLPSLLTMEIITTQPLHIISILTIIHSALGIIVSILGIMLVATWRLQSSLKNCFKNKKLMRPTTTIWLITLIVGFILYYFLYK